MENIGKSSIFEQLIRLFPWESYDFEKKTPTKVDIYKLSNYQEDFQDISKGIPGIFQVFQAQISFHGLISINQKIELKY